MTDAAQLPEILLVDDEQHLLDALKLRLRRLYRVSSAASGAEALELLRERSTPFAVIVSDMRMPGMNGAEFLAAAREVTPDSTRILLTGHTDVDAAITAVNEGNIFRFLTKPSPPTVLEPALAAGVAQHVLVVAQDRLLTETFTGSLAAMASLLELTQPLAFSRAGRVLSMVGSLARHAGRESWQLDAAARLSQLGAAVLPSGALARLDSGAPLDQSERDRLAALPGVAADVLAHVPRLEPVVQILRDAVPGAPQPGWEGRALRTALELDVLLRQGLSFQRAITLARAWGGADLPMLAEYDDMQSARSRSTAPTREVPASALKGGMILAADVKDRDGRLLLAAGYRITPVLARHIARLLLDAGARGAVKVQA